MKTPNDVARALVALHEIITCDVDAALLEKAIAERESRTHVGNIQKRLELDILRAYRHLYHVARVSEYQNWL